LQEAKIGSANCLGASMSEEGKVYWLKLQGSRHPALYIGETKASRYKYTLLVQKPSCCLVYKGGPKLDEFLVNKNAENTVKYAEEKAAFDLKYPEGTIPAEMSPSLRLFEAVEVVSYMQKGKKMYKVKKS